jgi:hypothetical protein
MARAPRGCAIEPFRSAIHFSQAYRANCRLYHQSVWFNSFQLPETAIPLATARPAPATNPTTRADGWSPSMNVA